MRLMKIGLFTDTYLPVTNGISYVVQIMQRNLEALGHEVYIFAPATNLRAKEIGDEPHVFRFPAVEGVFFDEQLTSVFFPSAAMRKIKKLDLDVIHFFTPAQIGLMGVYAATRQNIPLINQYSTDLYHYVERYPSVLPGTIALALTTPWMLKMTPRQMVRLMTVFKPKKTISEWHKSMVARMHKILHDHCDAVIALSKKMQKQLDSWGSQTHSTLLPTGVDALPVPTKARLEQFHNQFDIKTSDKILLYVGRMSREKNLDLLLDMFEYVAIQEPDAKLMFVGDFDQREELEAKSRASQFADRIIFTGLMPRQDLGVAYKTASAFVFPSITDTQGLVVNEAAAAGLPLVLCDEEVSEIFVAGETGLLAANEPRDFAGKVLDLLRDDKLASQLGSNGAKRATQYSEIGQMKKLEELYKKCIDNHKKVRFAGSEW